MAAPEMIVEICRYSSGFTILIFGGIGWFFTKDFEVNNHLRWHHFVGLSAFLVTVLNSYFLYQLLISAYVESTKGSPNFISDDLQQLVGAGFWSQTGSVILFVIFAALCVLRRRPA